MATAWGWAVWLCLCLVVVVIWLCLRLVWLCLCLVVAVFGCCRDLRLDYVEVATPAWFWWWLGLDSGVVAIWSWIGLAAKAASMVVSFFQIFQILNFIIICYF